MLFTVDGKLTLEELLAGIFLEECLVTHRTMKIVNHQLENGGNILFRVSCVVGKSRILKDH